MLTHCNRFKGCFYPHDRDHFTAYVKYAIIVVMNEQQTPFVSLGRHLKYVREQSKQSLMEVSGAVEIEEKSLELIEAGIERPAEEILLLLISHFNVAETEAVQLWELAKYDSTIPDQIKPEQIDLSNKPVVMVVGLDTRTMYSDGLDVVWTPSGVTMNFTQTGANDQSLAVARVGMSFDQAEQVLSTLQQAMLRAKYLPNQKLLPPTVSD